MVKKRIARVKEMLAWMGETGAEVHCIPIKEKLDSRAISMDRMVSLKEKPWEMLSVSAAWGEKRARIVEDGVYVVTEPVNTIQPKREEYTKDDLLRALDNFEYEAHKEFDIFS